MIAFNLKKHYLGKPCVHGHIDSDGGTIRYIKGRRCVTCSQDRFIRKTKLVLTCDVCSRKFKRAYENAKRSLRMKAKQGSAIYCSNRCRFVGSGSKMITCAYCGKTFKVDANRLRNSNPKYCSAKCRTVDSYEARFCAYCGRLFFRQQSILVGSEKANSDHKRYCNRRCANHGWKIYTEEELQERKKLYAQRDYQRNGNAIKQRARFYSARRRHFSGVMEFAATLPDSEREEVEALVNLQVDVFLIHLDCNRVISERTKKEAIDG